MTPFTATTHEAATIARAGMGGTVAIVRRLKVQPGNVNGAALICDDGYAVAGQSKPQPLPLSPGKPVWVKEGWWFCSECGQQNFMAGANRGGSMTGVYCASCDAFKDVKTDPAITMPREFARFTLTPETVQVCKMSELSASEIRAGALPYRADEWVMVALCKIGGVK